MPKLDSQHADVWFTALDYWFRASGVVEDDQKFEIVMSAIGTSGLMQMQHTLTDEPPVAKYQWARQRITAHFADSEQRRLNRLLSEMPLGDRRPSELYNEMRRVAGNVLGEAALKGLWATRLPEAARAVVAASTGTAAEFTRIADSIVDALTPRAIQQITSPAPLNELNELRAEIAELRRSLAKRPQRGRSRSRGNNNGGGNEGQPRVRTPARTNNDSNQNNDSVLCWYHQRYGRDARNCREPCRYFRQSNGTTANENNNA